MDTLVFVQYSRRSTNLRLQYMGRASVVTIYLDNNATTRPSEEVICAMVQTLREGWANPSSAHAFGQSAARLVQAAREQVAMLIGVSTDRVVFTSGATEANEAVLRDGVARGAALLTSAAEHPSVTGVYRTSACARLHEVALDTTGRWCLDALADHAGNLENPVVALCWANGETGVLQDVAAICALAEDHGATCLIDATQAVGRLEMRGQIPDNVYLSFSAHKLHGPKGVGVLVLPKDARGPCLLVGGGQEGGRRGGTENVPGIIGMGIACQLRLQTLQAATEKLGRLRDRLEARLLARLDHIRVNGAEVPRVPNTTSLTFPGVDGMALVARLEARGLLCSQVSACSSGNPEPSRTLLAMGLSSQEAFSSIRLSIAVDNTDEEIETAAQAIEDEVKFLREMMGGLV